MRVYFRYGLYHVDVKDKSYGIGLVCNEEYIGKDLVCVGSCRLCSVSQE